MAVEWPAEVEVGAPAVPELVQAGLAGAAGRPGLAHKGAAGRQRGVGGVVIQQAGLQVGHAAHAGSGKGAQQAGRVGELVGVPGENIALLATAGVAQAEVEGREGEALGHRTRQEGGDAGLRVGVVGHGHRGVGIAQAPARRQRGAANGRHKARQRRRQAGPGKDKAVQVTVGRNSDESMRLGLVVGDIDHGGAQAAVQGGDLGAHRHPKLGIQIGQRLVEEKDPGLAHDGPADGHALALAA